MSFFNTLGSGLGLMMLLLQQLQQRNASTQKFGLGTQTRRGPGPLLWKHFVAEAAEAAKT